MSDKPSEHSNLPQGSTVSVVGLWLNEVSGTTRPDRILAVTEYWWLKWLQLLGWERWFLITALRWLYTQLVGIGQDIEVSHYEVSVTQTPDNRAQFSTTMPALAACLGMSEKTLSRLLASEAHETDDKPWRQLRIRANAKDPLVEQHVKMARLFIPRLRYLSEHVDGQTRRVGTLLELVLDDLPTPEDAQKLSTDARRWLRMMESANGVLGFNSREESANSVLGISDQDNTAKGVSEISASANAKTEIGTPANAKMGSHASLLANTTIPDRQSTKKTVHQLTTSFPVQPPGISSSEAFNLALDKAIAFLPPKLRSGADASLYTLAAELHTTAVGQPSSRWPDAGGAGWVLDAVLDALGSAKTMRSLQLIRSITRRWLSEGNPYGMVDEPSFNDDPPVYDMAGVPFLDDQLPLIWEAATGRVLQPDEHGILESLVGPAPEGVAPSKLMQIIMELSTRMAREAITVEIVRAIVCHDMAMPPKLDTRFPEPPPVLPVVAQPSRLPDDDPVIGQVTEWYRLEIANRITQMVAEDLRDLTARQRNLDVWEYAFQASKHIGNTKGRWNYITTVVLDPDLDVINTWIADGKGPIRPDAKAAKARRQKRAERRAGKTGGGQKRAPVVSYDEMPEPEEGEDEPIEPPPDAR